jgi:hypothetical protein
MRNIIVSCILLLIVNQILLADGTLPEGSGTEADPYLISTLDNLLYLSTNDYLWGTYTYFSQTDDIDASDTENWNVGDHDNNPETPDIALGFSPIGYNWENSFFGLYDGADFAVENLYICRDSTTYVGLFGIISGSELSNINLIDANIISGNGVYNAGTLCAHIYSSEVYNCSSSGFITGVSGIGGIAGLVRESSVDNCNSNVEVTGTAGFAASISDSYISNCYNTGNVSGYFGIGGFAGNLYNCEIYNTYSTGVISSTHGGVGGLAAYVQLSSINNCFTSGNFNGAYRIGGMVGWLDEYSTINNSYSTANVTGNDYIAGLVAIHEGYSTITRCYSNGSVNGETHVGGLVATGYSTSHVYDSFWDMDTSGQDDSYEATGKTTTEMKDIATFTDLATYGLDEPWDFVSNPFDDSEDEDIWDIDPEINNGYPYLTTLPLVGAEEKVIPNSLLITHNLSNYPNPFNPTTTISFSLNTEHTENTEIYIYNVKGQQVDQLRITIYELGMNKVIWNAEKFASGVYFYKLNVKDSPIKKMVLLK